MGMLSWSPRTFCLVFAVVGLCGFVECWDRSRDDRAFDRDGKHALATAADKVQQDTYRKGNTVTGVAYHVDLLFTTEDGQQVFIPRMNLDRDHYLPAMAGAKLDLVYLPKHPTTVRWPGWEPQSAQGTWGALVVFLAAGTGFWILRKPR